MKPGKRATRIFFFASLLTISTVFLIRTRPVQATLGYMHIFSIYLRVETEIMQKTPAGQYYESLFWKHNDEVMQIMQAHPEHNEAFLQALIVFVPELEALLNGDGNKVYVTAKHVESLQAELDWFASTGSPALQEDIKREQQRLPLDQFVGMTMSESLDFINSTWSPDSPASKTPWCLILMVNGLIMCIMEYILNTPVTIPCKYQNLKKTIFILYRPRARLSTGIPL